jgi:hypothetical protein
MKEFLRLMWHDIKQRKNLELYFVLAVALVVFLADIFGVETISILVEIILAALTVLIYGMIEDRRTNERIEEKLEILSQTNHHNGFFSEWDSVKFHNVIESADEIWSLETVNYEFLHHYSETLKAFIKRGGKLRFILVDPESYSLKLSADNFPEQGDVESFKFRFRLSMGQLKILLDIAPSAENIQIKVIDHVPASITTLVDPQQARARAFITLNGFGMAGKQRPSFELTRKNQKWFEFYLSSFENLWHAEGARIISVEETRKIISA